MTQWEYCKIVQAASMLTEEKQGPAGPAAVLFLGPSRKETQTDEIGNPDYYLAQLGQEGWELVSYSLQWAVVEAGVTAPAPVAEIYYLKRPIEEAAGSREMQSGTIEFYDLSD